jgi:hypothetical protein
VVVLANRVVLTRKVASSSTTAVNLPVDSARIPSLTPNSKSLITKDNVVPYAAIANAQGVLPEACREMFERRIYFPLPCLTPRNILEIRTGMKVDQFAKCSDNERSRAKIIRHPIMDRYIAPHLKTRVPRGIC